MRDGRQDGLARVAQRLEEQSGPLVDQQLAALSRFPSYRRVPAEDLRRSCERNVLRVVTSLRGDPRLPPEIEEDEHDSGRRRALQGVPSDDVVAAYRAVLGVLRDAFLDAAASLSIPLDAVLAGTRRLWELTDRFSTELVSARHQLDLDLVRREERERLTFLHNALTGTLRPAELLEGGAAYGLRPDREYWVLRARAMTRSRGAAELISPLERATATPHHPPLLGLIGEDVAGITARPPDHGPDGALVAVEGPVPATGLHAAFVEATRQLEIAARFDLRGVVDAARLSLRAAVADQARLGEMLFRRYVAGVLADTAIAATILDSVRAYLDHRRSIPTTARALNVHVNTLRYRLQRFATITGADLQDTVTAMEVWWALQYARIRRRPEP